MQPKEPPFLEKISRQGYSLNLGDFVNQAGKLVKDNLGIFVAYSAIYGLILLIMNILSFVGLLAELLIAPSVLQSPRTKPAKETDPIFRISSKVFPDFLICFWRTC